MPLFFVDYNLTYVNMVQLNNITGFNMTQRIGFACKVVDTRTNVSKKTSQEYTTKMNFRSTTIKHLSKLSTQQQYEKLFDILRHNLQALRNQILMLSKLSPNRRMMRLGSDVCPVYSHHDFMWFYQQQEVMNYMEKNLKECGELARNFNVRLSFHPGQFCIIASDKEDVNKRGAAEFEYHVDIARMMGYTSWHQEGFAINIHVGSRLGGIPALRENILKLSETARNLITIENDEISFRLSDVLEVADLCPVVFDIHHEWVHTGEYVHPEDDRFKRVVDSWQGVRPKIHFSSSRKDLVGERVHENELPCINTLLEEGFKKQKLRAHSDMCWNFAVNDWALEFLPYADIMVEAKQKNLASKQLYDRALFLGVLNGES